MKTLITALALALAPAAWAQAPAANGGSPAKKELVQRILKLQQAGLEGAATRIAEMPALQMMQQAQVALQNRVAADKREALAKEMQADIRKYLEETVPPVRERVARVGPGVIGPLLDERFTEDELKQLAAQLESPVFRKYQQLLPELDRAMLQKVAPEVAPIIEPKARMLQTTLQQRLGMQQAAPAASAASPAAPKK